MFEDDIKEAISPETCVGNRNSLGGTSYEQVRLQLESARQLLAAEEKYDTESASRQVGL